MTSKNTSTACDDCGDHSIRSSQLDQLNEKNAKTGGKLKVKIGRVI